MKKKLSLDLDALAVDTFATSTAEAGRATVRAHDATVACQPTPPEYADCTCAASCLCKTAYYWCGDGYHTIYSCDHTANASCLIAN